MPIKDEIIIPRKGDQSFEGDVLPGTDGRWNLGTTVKRWREVIAKIGRFINVTFTGNLKPERGGIVYTTYTYIPIKEPYTNTDFNGDSFSSVGTPTKIENTSWSTSVPEDAVALDIRAVVRDSGSSTGVDLYFVVESTSSSTNAQLGVWPTGANNARTENTGTVPCTNGDIWYRCTASGTDTLDVWLFVTGYWI